MGGRLLTALLLVVACRTPPPRYVPPPPPIDPDVVERFRLGESAPSTLEPIHVLGRSPTADEEGEDARAASVALGQVLDSVEEHFPLVLAAQSELEAAEARLLGARGGFDTQLVSKGKLEEEGFYENERFDVSLRQPTSFGGIVFDGGYRLGQGDFPVYEGGDKTNEDGELRLGLVLPLLQGRVIDPRRVALWRARLQRDRADPEILRRRLAALRAAADAYWKWVAAGRVREVALRLLALAEDRTEQLRLAVEEGLLPAVNLTENERLIVDRRARLVAAERALERAAIELSLYWRSADGRPEVPSEGSLPYDFPEPRDASEVLLSEDESFALSARPEVRAVEIGLETLRLEGRLAENALLPKLDLALAGSQDVGSAVNQPDDKGDFELEAVLSLEVPLQRRAAKGRNRALEAQTVRLEREAQYLRERVVAEVQDARSALARSWQSLGPARENLRLANELADAERFQLTAGESDLLRVNLREQQAAVAAADLVAALEEHFRAVAVYRVALGIPHGGVPLP